MTTREQFTVSGSELVEKVKKLIHEGNIRRVRLLHEGKDMAQRLCGPPSQHISPGFARRSRHLVRHAG